MNTNFKYEGAIYTMTNEHVLIVYFNVESEAFQALSEIRQNTVAHQGFVLFEQASLIKREHGNILIKDGFHNGEEIGGGMALGSVIGSFIGILGGPLGVLLGMGAGATLGSLPALNDAEEKNSLIRSVTTRLQDGEMAILAVVQEENEQDLDQYFGKFDTMIIRYDAGVIEEEIEYAEKLQEDLAHQAQAAMKKERSDERKKRAAAKRDSVHTRFESLKEKFTRDN